jgi:hypothetical protein
MLVLKIDIKINETRISLKKKLFKFIKKLKIKDIKLKLNNPKKIPVKKLLLKSLIPKNL